MEAEVLSLHPTLWRTCRAIANRTRLRILQLLLSRSDQTVSAIATQLSLPHPVASQYLRVLEARSLLTVQRGGRWAKYRLSGTPPTGLTAALAAEFRCESDPVERVFKLATAFTHPRRIEIYKLLNAQPRTVEELRAATKISSWALSRHLSKLESRKFIVRQERRFAVVSQTRQLPRELARLAVR